MPFSGSTFTHLFDWEKDPQRNEKIVNARLEAEFDGIDTGLSTVSANTRERLTAARNYYVNGSTGSDSNSGLASGTAFATIQKAVDVVSGTLDLATYTVTINVAAGTYTGAVILKPLVGRGSVVILGDTTTPSNCVISTTSATAITCAVGGWDLRGFKTVTTTAGHHISADGGECLLYVRQWEFGAAANFWNHVDCANSARVWLLANYSVSGAAYAHVAAQSGGNIQLNNLGTIVVSGSPTMGYCFALASRSGGIISGGSTTFSGAVTGTRYIADMNGTIQTFGAGASHFPGSVAGTTATGGQYA